MRQETKSLNTGLEVCHGSLREFNMSNFTPVGELCWHSKNSFYVTKLYYNGVGIRKHLFIFLIEVYFIYNVVLIYFVQQSDSVYIYIF